MKLLIGFIFATTMYIGGSTLVYYVDGNLIEERAWAVTDRIVISVVEPDSPAYNATMDAAYKRTLAQYFKTNYNLPVKAYITISPVEPSKEIPIGVITLGTSIGNLIDDLGGFDKAISHTKQELLMLQKSGLEV